MEVERPLPRAGGKNPPLVLEREETLLPEGCLAVGSGRGLHLGGHEEQQQ